MKVNCNGSEKILGLLPVKLYSKRAIYGFIFEFDHLKLGYCVTTESRVYKFAEETLRKLKQFSRKTFETKKKNSIIYLYSCTGIWFVCGWFTSNLRLCYMYICTQLLSYSNTKHIRTQFCQVFSLLKIKTTWGEVYHYVSSISPETDSVS